MVDSLMDCTVYCSVTIATLYHLNNTENIFRGEMFTYVQISHGKTNSSQCKWFLKRKNLKIVSLKSRFSLLTSLVVKGERIF